ncbi:CinA family protein [Novosphingobium sp.]|jgi:nicotinamide-nucleotide amidase|uniref:CinA family protein n=1 Tax=Novosphingobium sp. TaxID=1874826 RepID=UPI002FDDC6EC
MTRHVLARDIVPACGEQTPQVMRRAAHVLELAASQRLAIATAESCTGGLIASMLTDVEGLGRWFDRGFVTYSVEAKVEMLGIEPMLLRRHDPVSETIAHAMAHGALARSRAGVAIAVTGNAGEAGRHDEAGLAYIAVVTRDGRAITRECHYGPRGRDAIRLELVGAAFAMATTLLGNA